MIPFMVARIHDIDFIVTERKGGAPPGEHADKGAPPEYNVFFRTTRITTTCGSTWTTRSRASSSSGGPKKDGAVYFGPIRRAWLSRRRCISSRKFSPCAPARMCSFRSRQRPCLEYEIRPLPRAVLRPHHPRGIRGDGEKRPAVPPRKEKTLLKDLKEKMKAAASRFDFEDAARLRDIIRR